MNLGQYKIDVEKNVHGSIIVNITDSDGNITESDVTMVLENFSQQIGKDVSIDNLHSISFITDDCDDSLVVVSLKIKSDDKTFIKSNSLNPDTEYLSLEYIVSPKANILDVGMCNKIYLLDGKTAICQDIDKGKIVQNVLIQGGENRFSCSIGQIIKCGMTIENIPYKEIIKDKSAEESLAEINAFLNDYMEEMEAYTYTSKDIYMGFELRSMTGVSTDPVIPLSKHISISAETLAEEIEENLDEDDNMEEEEDD